MSITQEIGTLSEQQELWKTIEKDGMPKPGTFCLCETKSEVAWCNYHIYYYGMHPALINPAFIRYDMVIPTKNILRYIEIQKEHKK